MAANETKEHVVITLHGIRTFGGWQERLEGHVKAQGIDFVYNYKYGYFSVFAFLIPFMRWSVTLRFRNWLKKTISKHPHARIDIVAHSFGTHIAAWAIYGIRDQCRGSIHTILLAGSVLKPGFRWGDLLDDCVYRVVNDCGTKDMVLVLNQAVVLFTGMAGRVGFSGGTYEKFRNRFFNFGHSGYFSDDGFMRKWWVPLLTKDDPPQLSERTTKTFGGGAAVFLLNNIEPVKLIAYALLLAIPGLAYYSLYQSERVAHLEVAKQKDKVVLQRAVAWSGELAANSIQQLTVDPDVSTLLALRAWDVAPTEQAENALRLSIREPHAHGILSGFNRAVFSADSMYLLVGASNKTEEVWKLDEWRKIVTLSSSEDGPSLAIAVSPDDKTVLAMTSDGTVRIYAAETGELLGKPLPKQLSSFRKTPSEDGLWIYSHFPDGGAEVIDQATKVRQLLRLPVNNEERENADRKWVQSKHTGYVFGIAYTADAKHCVSASEDKTALIFDVEKKQMKTGLYGHSGRVSHASFSRPDGNFVVTASFDKTARIWEVDTGITVAVLRGHKHELMKANFSPDGKWVVTVGKSSRCWKVSWGAHIQETAQNEYNGEVRSMEHAEFSSDGRLLLTSSTKYVHLWSVSPWQQIARFKGAVSQQHGRRFSPSDARYLLARLGKTARIWNTETHQEVAKLDRHTADVTYVTFSPDGKLIVTVSKDGTAGIWETESWKFIALLHHRDIQTAEFAANGRWIVTRGGGLSRIWDLESTEKPVVEFPGVNRLAGGTGFSPNGERVLSTGVWDIKSETQLLKPRDQWKRATSAAFSRDGKYIVTVDDRTACVWDSDTGELINELDDPDGDVISASFHPNGKFVVTASRSGEGSNARVHVGHVWNTKNGSQPLLELRGHRKLLTGAQFSPDGKWIVTTSDDNTAQIFSAGVCGDIDELRKLGREQTNRALTIEEERRFVPSELRNAVENDSAGSARSTGR